METVPPPAPPSPEATAAAVPPSAPPAPNLVLAVIGGLVAAVIGAAVWAGIAFATGRTIGYIAIGVGFLVGFAIRMLGRGSGTVYGTIGALCAFIGCLLGDVLAVVALISKERASSFFAELGAVTMDLPVLILQNQGVMGWVIYAIAVYFGFKFSSAGGTPAS